MVVHLEFQILAHHVGEEGSYFNLHVLRDSADIKIVNEQVLLNIVRHLVLAAASALPLGHLLLELSVEELPKVAEEGNGWDFNFLGGEVDI